MTEKSSLFFLLFFATISFTFSFSVEAQNIIITNFINESGYRGDWDIENDFPQMLREILIRKKQEIPIWRKRHWRDDAQTLKKKFPSRLVISGRITEFSYTSSLVFVWPVLYKDAVARDEIILEIIKEGEIFSEQCNGEEAKRDIQLDLLSRGETEVDELTGIKFGDSVFETTLPGKATKKVIDECIARILKYLD